MLMEIPSWYNMEKVFRFNQMVLSMKENGIFRQATDMVEDIKSGAMEVSMKVPFANRLRPL